MTQDSLDFGALQRCADAHRELVRALEDAVQQVGLLTAAGACGCDHIDLRKALNGDKGRYIRSTWPARIAAIAPADTRERIARAMVAALGFDVTSPRPLTPEQRLARLEQRVASELGAAGARLVEENRR